MTYFNWLDYNDMADEPDHFLNNIKVVNFDIINHKCRGTALQKSYKNYKTIEKDYLKEYPEQDRKKFLSAACHNSKKDLRVKQDLTVEHFKSFK